MTSNRIPCKCAFFLLLMSLFYYSCGDQKGKNGTSAPALTKNSAHELSFEMVSRLLQDMKRYSDAVKKLDSSLTQQIDQDYQGVRFTTQQPPLFLNVYPDASGGRVIFLLVQKHPSTGSNYLLTFDKKLPVIDSETVELQIRTKDPEKPLTCSMQVADTASYMTAYPSHELIVEYEFTKKFLQSGTYDFDALTVPSYRQRGYAFITFDLAKASVKDQTANLTADCN